MDQIENKCVKKGMPISFWQYRAQEVKIMRKIEILGIGCLRCAEITERAKQAVKELRIDAEVIKVEDIEAIANYGVLALPALAVDGVIKIAGNIPEVEEIKEWVKGKD
jgi:small redox-active disulfide protein 2